MVVGLISQRVAAGATAIPHTRTTVCRVSREGGAGPSLDGPSHHHTSVRAGILPVAQPACGRSPSEGGGGSSCSPPLPSQARRCGPPGSRPACSTYQVNDSAACRHGVSPRRRYQVIACRRIPPHPHLGGAAATPETCLKPSHGARTVVLHDPLPPDKRAWTGRMALEFTGSCT